jgi:hypothetical protein
MKTDNALGTFDAILQGHTPAIREAAVALRRLIARIYPTSIETPRKGDGCITYGIGPRKMIHTFAYIMPFADHVNLGFFQGTKISDPNSLLVGTGKAARHVKLMSAGDVSSTGLKALIEASILERRISCGETSKFMKPP